MELKNDEMTLLNDVNRVEVIDETGRVYVNTKSSNIVNAMLQDNGRTLKIFIACKWKI